MITDWLSEDGRKAIDKMGGWPRWDVATPRPYNPSRLRLLYEDRSKTVEIEGQLHENRCWTIETDQGRGDWTHCRAASAYEALALLRDRAREWLEERGISVTPFGVMDYSELLADKGGRWYCLPCHMPDIRDPKHKIDHDAALIAAVLATESK